MLDAEVLGYLALEGFDFGSEDEAAGAQHTLERGTQLVLDRRVLRAEVEQRDRVAQARIRGRRSVGRAHLMQARGTRHR